MSVEGAGGRAFSLSVGLRFEEEEDDLEILWVLLKIWTLSKAGMLVARGRERKGERKAIGYIELPSFNVLAGFFVGDHDDELGDFAADHPFVELGHDFFDVRFDLVVRCD